MQILKTALGLAVYTGMAAYGLTKAATHHLMESFAAGEAAQKRQL